MSLELAKWRGIFGNWALVVLALLALLAAKLLEPYHLQLSWLAYACSYLAGGYEGVRSAIASLKKKEVDIDLLMVLAALGAACIGVPFEGALLLWLFALSNALCQMAFRKTQAAFDQLASRRSSTVFTRRSGNFVPVPVDEVVAGEVVWVRQGDELPLDGKIVKGEAFIDEKLMTGEPIPRLKGEGDKVFAGTFNCDGDVEVEVKGPASESMLTRIFKMVEASQKRKASAERFLERFEKRYALFVLTGTCVFFLSLLLWGVDFSLAAYRAMTLMVVASPCALVIATPVAVLSALARGGQLGILFRGGIALEHLSEANAIAFDKTGTLTEGRPRLKKIQTCPSALWRDLGLKTPEAKRQLLALVASAEAQSKHPLALALVQEAEAAGLPLFPATRLPQQLTRSLSCEIQDTPCGPLKLWIGALASFPHKTDLSTQLTANIQSLEQEGHTVLLAASHAHGPLGFFALKDNLRQETLQALQHLRTLGVGDFVMLTGDNELAASKVAHALHIPHCHAALLPHEKAEYVRELGEKKELVMVGDGFNDAPALSEAKVGVAMGLSGSDLALQAADIILMESHLGQLVDAFVLSKATRKIVWQNLSLATSTILLMVLSVFILPLWGQVLPLPLAVLAHEGSTVLTCLNALRLLRVTPAFPKNSPPPPTPHS